MKVSIISKKPIFDDRKGKLTKGQTVELPAQKAMFYIQRGEAVAYETKVMQERPSLAAGTTEQSQSSPAAPASPETTASASEYGVKRRGRPKKEEQSQ